MDESASLPHALAVIEQAKDLIHEVEALLPASPNANFRERLAAYLETVDDIDLGLRQKVDALLIMYQKVFGVGDLVEKTDPY